MDSTEMLLAIFEAPIVSSGTFRPDDLCAALLAEVERLGVDIDRRDLWQPATAIVAHGRKPGCLDLPPRLGEISGELVSDLFDALNSAAPSGCWLGASEGDGSLFLWTLSTDAQVDALNARGRFEAKALEVPEHWLSALINGDESSFDYYGDEKDYQAYQAFCRSELGDGWTVSCDDTEGEFSVSHDASYYGVLPCQTVSCIAMRIKPAQVSG